MTSSHPETEALSALSARLEKSQRRSLPLLVAGLLLVIGGLLLLTVQLSQQRDAAKDALIAEAEARQAATKAANASAQNLLEARVALAEGRTADLKRILEQGERNAEANAQAAALPSVSAADVSLPPISAVTASRTFMASSADPTFTQKVFIQFAGLIQRADVAAVNRALRSAGWKTQGASGERIGTAAGLNEVRFSSEADRLAAEALAKALTEAGLGDRPVIATRNPTIRPGTLEAWISRN